ncbi:MAG TPA: redoxin domain-containing protein [Anaerolineales bacterium]|nr:redoxin domain-containing protein [Anaerolineales bacterium]
MDTMILIHQPAPEFSLPDLGGEMHSLSEHRGRVVVLNFWSAECPHVARTDSELNTLLKSWGERVSLLSVASNINEPVELLQRVAAERGLPLVLHDPDHQVADRYGVLINPHYFVIDPQGILRYQGAFDDITFRQRTASQAYLRQAVEAVLAGQQPDPEQTPPYGCTIVRHRI